MEASSKYMDYLMAQAQPVRLSPRLHPPARSAAFAVNGLAVRETMRPGMVNRPGGTRDFLFMQFHCPVDIGVGDASRECPPESFVLWEPGAPHRYGNGRRKWSHSWLHCDGTGLEAAVRSSGIPLNVPLLLPDAAIAERILLELHVELTGHPRPDPAIAEALVGIWLRRLRRAAAADAAPPVPSRVLAAQAFMERSCGETVTLERLASFAGLSVSHFSAEFRRHLGMPPMRYLLELRLRRAAYLLADANLSIAEVAREAGFQDPLYFSRQFRRRFGASPRLHRRNMREPG